MKQGRSLFICIQFLLILVFNLMIRVKTSTSLTENLLSKRIRFSCRILTRDGKDALRELFGFYFMLDRTLAIYEFRVLGKRSNALPLIPRGQYLHLSGYNQGQPYTLLDIYQVSH